MAGGTTFEYQADTGLLTKAVNFDGVGLTVSYENPGSYDSSALDNYAVQACRVLAIEQISSGIAGAKQSFEYLHLNTRVTSFRSENAGKTITYQFNNAGNVVSMYDELGFAQFNAFSDTVPNQQMAASKLQRSVINLLSNLDFSANWAPYSGNSGDILSLDANTRCLNMPSYKIQCTGTEESACSQTVSVQSGKSYTFSAYVRSENACRAYLRVRCGNDVRKSRMITASTVATGSSNAEGWERLFVTMGIPESDTLATVKVILVGANGTVWFSAPQLEEGRIPNRVNLLLNGDFSRTVSSGSQTFAADWYVSEGIDDHALNGVISAEAAGLPAALSGNALRIHSYCNTGASSHCQSISAKGSKGDVFVIGGWINSTSVALGGGHYKPVIISRFKKTDGDWTSWQYNEYGTEQVGWKFGAWAVAAPENYTEFRIGIQYARNSGTCMFSNMFVYREQFAESFAYDEDNNLISTTNLSAEKSDMKYDAFDNLTSYVQPGADSADKYLFTYGSTDEEKKKHLVMSETTPMGLKQYYAYDAYGNRTATRAQKSSSEPRIRSCTWYDSTGNYPVRTMDARGNEVRREVDADSGLIYNVTDPAGQKVEYTYDTSKRVTGVQTTDGDKVYKNAYGLINGSNKKVGDFQLSGTIYNTDQDGILHVKANYVIHDLIDANYGYGRLERILETYCKIESVRLARDYELEISGAIEFDLPWKEP